MSVANQQIADTLVWLREVASSSGDWVTTQAPLAAQELIRWQIYSNLGIVAVCFVITVIGILYARRIWRKKVRTDSEEVLGFMIPAALVILIAPFAVFGMHEAGKAYFAPRIVILETMGKMIDK